LCSAGFTRSQEPQSSLCQASDVYITLTAAEMQQAVGAFGSQKATYVAICSVTMLVLGLICSMWQHDPSGTVALLVGRPGNVGVASSATALHASLLFAAAFSPAGSPLSLHVVVRALATVSGWVRHQSRPRARPLYHPCGQRGPILPQSSAPSRMPDCFGQRVC
jgi:hypothetical protein